MRIARHFLFVLLTLAFVLSACGQAAQEPTPLPPSPLAATQPAAPAAPVILKAGWLGSPDTLNPAYAFLVEAYTIFDLVYTPLTTEAPSGEYVGGLAQEWSHSDDGLTWTFILKDGIRWHTGENLTADDVAFAINAVINNPDGWAALSGYVSGFIEARALDAKTLEIALEAPISNMEYRLSFLYAVYPPDFKDFTGVEDLQNFTNFEIVGTGPFKINTFDKDRGVLILDVNPDYFDGAPAIQQIIFQTFDNSDAMIQALKVGDIDMINEVPPSAFAALAGFNGVKAIRTPGRYFNELIINSVPADNDPAPIKNPALDDPQVRLAIAHAINKQDIVDIAAAGLGSPGLTIVPPTLGGGYWQNNSITDTPFNLEEANRILEQAGYTRGADGVRAQGDLRLEFRLQFPSDNDVYPRVADLLTTWFMQAGIKTTPEAVDPDSLYVQMTPAGDFDLVIWGWGPDPDPDFILSVMTTDQFVDGGWSDSGYMNPEYDQLYLDQQVALEKDERRAIIWKMQELVFNDRPYIVLWYEDLLQAYRSDHFTGFIQSPLGIEIAPSLMQVQPLK